VRGEQSARTISRQPRHGLIGDVAANYVEARGYQARIALAQRTAVRNANTEKLTRSKYDAGRGNAVDLAKATAQAASTEANVPTIRPRLRPTFTGSNPCSAPADGLASLLAQPAPVPHRRMPLPTGLPGRSALEPARRGQR